MCLKVSGVSKVQSGIRVGFSDDGLLLSRPGVANSYASSIAFESISALI